MFSLAFASLFLVLKIVFPYLQNPIYVDAISNGDVTLGPSSTINAVTNITSSVANIGTDTIVYDWIRGAGEKIARVNIPFDNGSPVTDFGPSSNTITTNAGATREANPSANCKVGDCYNFSGTTSGFINLGDDDVYEPNEITIETWVYVTGNGTHSDGNYIVVKGRVGAVPYYSYVLSYIPSSDKFICGVNATGGRQWAQSTSTFAPNSSWVHVACTYDGSNVNMYINGVLEESNATSGYIGYTLSNQDLYIGKWGLASYTRAFQGRLDELKIYGEALSANQVALNCNAGDSDGDCSNGIDAGQGIGGPTTIHADHTSSGETWKLEATPISSTGTIGTTVKSSGTVFITGSTLTPSDISLNAPNEAGNVIPTINSAPGASEVAFQFINNGVPYLRGYWPFHDNTSTLEKDISGNDFHARVFTNSPTYETFASGNCQVGNCYTFSGTQNIAIPNFRTISEDQEEVSVFAWVKADGTSNTTSFVSHYDTGSNQRSWYAGKGPANPDRLRILVSPNGATSTYKDYYASSTTWDNTLKHVGFTFNAGELKLFVNGVEDPNPIKTRDDAMTTLYRGVDNITIGSYLSSNALAGGWIGSIDEVMVFDRALSQLEITQIYNDGAANNHAPSVYLSSQTSVADVIGVSAFEVGSLFGPMQLAEITIQPADETTISGVATVGSAPFSDDIEVNYTCSLASSGSESRDVLVEFSINGGFSYADATLVSASEGSINNATIQSITCDGTQKSFVWDSFADGVAYSPTTENDVRIRVTAQVGLTNSDETTDFTVENPGLETITTTQTMVPGDFSANTIYVFDGNITVTIDQELTDPTINVHSLILQNGADLIHPSGTPTTLYKVDFTASDSIQIDSGTTINTLSDGYPAGESFGGNTLYNHGGLNASETDITKTYGTPQNPTHPGSGGASGPGGGVIFLSSDTFVLNGILSTNSNQSTFGHGAGGSVKITTTGEVSGSGSITSNSTTFGNGATAGAGGRIAFYYSTSGGINTTPPQDLFTIQAFGGNSSSTDSGAGTIYIEDTNSHTSGEGILILDNNNIGPDDSPGTPISISGVETFSEIIVRNSAKLLTREIEVVDQLSVSNSGIVTPPSMVSEGPVERLLINASTAAVSIDATSIIRADGIGPVAGETIDTINDIAVIGGNLMVHGGITRDSTDPSVAYGEIHNPQFPGNAGPSYSGGGYIKLEANDLDLEGEISADGVSISPGQGTGAGGGVYIDVSGEYTGSGIISAKNPTTFGNGSTAGAGGRIAFYYTTTGGINATPPQNQFDLQANGGYSSNNVSGAGTIYIEDANAVALGTYATSEGVLILDNNNYTDNDTDGTPIAYNGSDRFYQVIIDDGAHAITGNLTVDDSILINDVSILTAESLSVTNSIDVLLSSNLTHQDMVSGGNVTRLDINIPSGTLTIDATSSIDVTGKGAEGGEIINEAGDNAVADSKRGSHGGLEENEFDYDTVYDSIFTPNFPGSGGDSYDGGGYISIEANDLVLDGDIHADSEAGAFGQGRGSGGGILIEVNNTYSGTGSITAENTSTFGNGGATGGGGRIAFKYTTAGSINATYPYDQFTFDASGGISSGTNGSAGTVYIEDRNTHTLNQGDLIIDNKNVNSSNVTPLFYDVNTSLTINNLSVLNLAKALIETPCGGANALTVNGSIDLSGGGSIVNNQPGTCTIALAPLDLPETTRGPFVVSQPVDDQIPGVGGYSPYTYECLDGLGGSVIACDAGAGLPTGVSISSSGGISGTPTVSGAYNVIVRITDSDPGGSSVHEDTISIVVSTPPNEPVLVSPTDGGSSGGLLPTLQVSYSDPDAGDTGTITVRVSTGSSADCINNVNISETITSSESSTDSETINLTLTNALTDGLVYHWCAIANDGGVESNSGVYTSMGSFTATVGGGSQRQQQAISDSGDGSDDTSGGDSGGDTGTGEDATPGDDTSGEDTDGGGDDDGGEPGDDEFFFPDILIPDEIIIEDPWIPGKPSIELIEELEEAPGDKEPPPPPGPPTGPESDRIDDIIINFLDDEVDGLKPGNDDDKIIPPSEAGIKTDSQSDGRSFTIQVEDEVTEKDLIVTGNASTDEDRIEFTGNTSEPDSTITLIFNDTITVVVTSDANGFWQTFVSAEQLGISKGQSATVRIDAIAVKDDLRSSKVSIGEVDLIFTNDELLAEFQSIVEESIVITNIQSIADEVVVLIKEQEVAIQQTLVSVAPLFLISSAPLWGYLPYFPVLIYHFITYFFGLIGKRKQEDRLYGQVYNAITKEPLSLAILRVYEKESNKLVSTYVTDKQGRYDFLLEKGVYRVEVKKPQFVFPSKIVTSSIDGVYANVYSEEKGIISNGELLSLPDIPVDPINNERLFSLSGIFKKFWVMLQRMGHVFVLPGLCIGSVIASVTLYVSPESPVNWLITVLYVLFFVLQLRLREKIVKAWGIVYELATSAPLPLTTIQLIDPKYGKVIMSRLTDYQGRFAFLPDPGDYIVKASKEGYQQPEEHLKQISVQKEGQRIQGDIPMKML